MRQNDETIKGAKSIEEAVPEYGFSKTLLNRFLKEELWDELPVGPVSHYQPALADFIQKYPNK